MMHANKKEPYNYFNALSQLAGIVVQLLEADADGSGDPFLAEAMRTYRALKSALASEYVPPMERSDILRLAAALFVCTQHALLVGNAASACSEADSARAYASSYAKNVEACVELLPGFRRADRFSVLLKAGDALYQQLLAACTTAEKAGARPRTDAVRACAEALWAAQEAVEGILIKYA